VPAAGFVIASGTLTFSNSGGQQNIPGPSSGPVRLLVRANADNVYIGGDGVANSLPASGFKLTQEKEYVFRLNPMVGSSTENGVFVATTSGTNVTVSYVVTYDF
jgi:hypothetical protein